MDKNGKKEIVEILSFWPSYSPHFGHQITLGTKNMIFRIPQSPKEQIIAVAPKFSWFRFRFHTFRTFKLLLVSYSGLYRDDSLVRSVKQLPHQTTDTEWFTEYQSSLRFNLDLVKISLNCTEITEFRLIELDGYAIHCKINFGFIIYCLTVIRLYTYLASRCPQLVVLSTEHFWLGFHHNMYALLTRAIFLIPLRIVQF